MVNYIFTCKLCGESWFAVSQEEGWEEAEKHFEIYHPDTAFRRELIKVQEIFGVWPRVEALKTKPPKLVREREKKPPQRIVELVCRECGYRVIGRESEAWAVMKQHAEKSHRKLIRELRIIEMDVSPYDYWMYKQHSTFYKTLKKLSKYLKDPKTKAVIDEVVRLYTEASTMFIDPREIINYLRQNMPRFTGKSLEEIRRLEDAWRTALMAIETGISVGIGPEHITLVLTDPKMMLEQYVRDPTLQPFIKVLVL